MVSGLERNPLNTGSRVSASLRGILQMPCALTGPDPFIGVVMMAEREVTRVLAVKLERLEPEMWRFLRERAWEAMRYRNLFLRARWAEAAGLCVDPQAAAKAEKPTHDVTKWIRRDEKGSLSGAAYSAAEREVAGVWQRDGKRILAGAPLSEWRQNAVLSVRGHKVRAESGVRIEQVGARFVLALCVASQETPGGCWVRLPIATGKEIKQYQAGTLLKMLSWETPISKAVVCFSPDRGRAEVRLSYPKTIIVSPMGDRVATLTLHRSQFGPRLVLRTETEERDYTLKLSTFAKKKDEWDLIRRRVTAQIGRCKGSARLKRKRIASIGFADWADTFLHQWSHALVTWCASQGVGTLRLDRIANGDWPADRFTQMLRYKGEERGVTVTDMVDASITEPATERAVTMPVKREQRRAKKVREALRTLNAEYTEE
jgi:hypothetical protein